MGFFDGLKIYAETGRGPIGRGVGNSMAYDEALACRLRSALVRLPDVTEKKMFGGLAFLLDGKMFVGIVKDELMVRVGPERFGEALGKPHVRPMDFTGRPMKGYVFVGADGCGSVTAVKPWVERGAEFAATLEKGARRPNKTMAWGRGRKKRT